MTSTSNLGLCLVTGAAGYTGSHLVNALLEEGYTVRALIRSTPLKLEHKNLELFTGDIQDAQQMLQACEGVNTVFHTAAMIATLGGSAVSKSYRDSARAVNVQGTINVISACQATDVSRLVHTSSVDTCFAGKEDLHMELECTPKYRSKGISRMYRMFAGLPTTTNLVSGRCCNINIAVLVCV